MEKIRTTLLAIFLVITTVVVGYISVALITKKQLLPPRINENELVDKEETSERELQINCREKAEEWLDEMTLIISSTGRPDFRNEKIYVDSYFNQKHGSCLLLYKHKISEGTVGVDEKISKSAKGIFDLTNERAVIYVEDGDDMRDYKVIKDRLFE